MKLPAPALDKGITVLQLLAEEGELSLETICNLTQIPKASLLRFLETLIAKGCVFKDPETKKYRALMQVVPIEGQSNDFMRLVSESVTQLSVSHDVTAEWYEPYDEGARITMRHEPEHSFVRVVARVGFSRVFNYIFEAVIQVVLACDRSKYSTEHDQYFKVDWREKRSIDEDEILKDLDTVEQNSYLAVDQYYNDNGVMRLAAAVRDEDGTLQGVLALAFSYEPSQDQYIEKALIDLKRTVAVLEQQLRTMKYKN